ncbi:MAG: ADP-glyceromanno-heptose 6-epimerase [Bdellovibrionota bacterium]
MKIENRIIITGAAGFIGSQLASFLIKNGHLAQNILLVDDIHKYNERVCTVQLRKNDFEICDWHEFPQLLNTGDKANVIFHMGAISNTEEKSKDKLNEQNLHYSQKIWNYCTENEVPLYYASSASTYGAGEFGFEDNSEKIPQYKPLNLYAQSKQDFDLWVLNRIQDGHTPKKWAGFKFFNVYGAGEDHKGSQGSVVWHAKRQFEEKGVMKLFKSHNPDFKDGEQARDFVYVGDVCNVLNFFYTSSTQNGIFNLGSGKARTFKDLVAATAAAINVECKIEYIPTPESLRAQYQYFTEASLDKLRKAGYTVPMTELEEGVKKAIEDDKELKS